MKTTIATLILTLACSTSFAYESRQSQLDAQAAARAVVPTADRPSSEIFIIGQTEVRQGQGGAELHYIVTPAMDFQITVGSVGDLCPETGSYELKEVGIVYEILSATCL